MRTVIAIIAAELSRSNTGKVILGPETIAVCNNALDYPADLLVKAFMGNVEDHVILGDYYYAVMACKPPNQTDGQPMCELMKKYLMSKGVEEGWILTNVATHFHTNGELGALASLVEERKFDRVIIVARWWHMPRVKFLWLFHQIHFTRKVEEVFVNAPSKYWVKIFTDPTLGIIHNIFRWLVKGH